MPHPYSGSKMRCSPRPTSGSFPCTSFPPAHGYFLVVILSLLFFLGSQQLSVPGSRGLFFECSFCIEEEPEGTLGRRLLQSHCLTWQVRLAVPTPRADVSLLSGPGCPVPVEGAAQRRGCWPRAPGGRARGPRGRGSTLLGESPAVTVSPYLLRGRRHGCW